MEVNVYEYDCMLIPTTRTFYTGFSPQTGIYVTNKQAVTGNLYVFHANAYDTQKQDLSQELNPETTLYKDNTLTT